MAKVLLTTIFLFSILPKIEAQESSFQSKSNTIKKVYQDILLAYADVRPAPEITLISNSQKQINIAQYIPSIKPSIRIDEKLYDICTSFGRDSLNALAGILSHELAHYYQNHNWCSDYAFALKGESLGEKLKYISKEEKIRCEAQADQLGVFYAAMAGYATFDVFPSLLDTIYEKYALPDNIEGYPTKYERKQISTKTIEESRQLFDIFEAAKLMLLLKEYEVAALCFEQVSKRFPSREILNNLGTCALFLALEQMPIYYMPFCLPIEIDANSRLSSSDRGESSSDDWKNNLNKAKHYFEDALRLDQNYTPAYLNLACVHLLNQNPEAAIGKINELNANSSFLSDNALQIQAIAYYFSGQSSKAISKMEAITNKIKSKYNQEILTWLIALPELYDEKKHSIDFADFILTLIPNFTLPVKSVLQENQPLSASSVKADAFEDSRQISDNPPIEVMVQRNQALQCLVTTPTKNYQFVQTPLNYQGQTAHNLSIGSNLHAVIKAYGLPDYSMIEANTTYWIYSKAGIIFNVGKEDQLRQWILFKVISN
jgi:tetratricopeptide (TPR) repeat protein